MASLPPMILAITTLYYILSKEPAGKPFFILSTYSYSIAIHFTYLRQAGLSLSAGAHPTQPTSSIQLFFVILVSHRPGNKQLAFTEHALTSFYMHHYFIQHLPCDVLLPVHATSETR